ncbi:DUF7521 family protein [Natrinema longum]|uniref:Uncharacterized protein n=1 Tax=Natrinema longum TaxID=370324 RepID=A0A8A2U6V3_9EURY|nr:hypothetical protein [Natrinema longum]MBZ6495037.1 hypothetical protein [Natrinema longum]QSW83668.1 hypothetical protein J0X27_09240 [Natrinema longum]
MNDYTLFIATANTATVLTGGAVALLAYRAFRRTGATALRAVAVGFGVIVVGSLLGGGVHLFGGSLGVGNPVGLGVAIQSGATALGFGILLYSLYAETADMTVSHELSL